MRALALLALVLVACSTLQRAEQDPARAEAQIKGDAVKVCKATLAGCDLYAAGAAVDPKLADSAADATCVRAMADCLKLGAAPAMSVQAAGAGGRAD